MIRKLPLKLPSTATKPFCPSEARHTISYSGAQKSWRRFGLFAGSGMMIAVGYMDPGNWATDIEAGSRFGAGLLFVVLFSSLAAILLQLISARLGIATGRDLAQLSRDTYSRKTNIFLWLMAELSIIACDLAEVIGCALAFHLLLGVPMLWGIALTVLDTLFILGLKDRNFRTLEAIILALVLTIGCCFFFELLWLKPNWSSVVDGMLPSLQQLNMPHATALAVGIIGATVMPHNLYLHSSIVQTRIIDKDTVSKRQAINLSGIDTVISLCFAFAVNAGIMIVAARAFHDTGQLVMEIQDAHDLLAPIVGTAAASLLFAIALLAAGQSSTFTGTIAGQVIFEGFLDLKIPCWQRRLITRALALIPAVIGIVWLGDGGVGKLLVLSQIVLSLQLPFAMYPLIRFASNEKLMGELKTGWLTTSAAWCIFAIITAGNIWMLLA